MANKRPDADDLHHMRAALNLARRGLGNVWPNPAVGCVLVREDLAGRVVGRGWTQPGGRPHAETEALARAGAEARGATAYVTLEPCDHEAATPPCSEALIAAGIGRTVVATEDPDPRVSGKGLARLEGAGVALSTGVAEAEARRLNEGFFLSMREGRPLITLKVAATLDGRIATRGGESRWITGPEARAFAHRLRADHDAVMIGIGTALADDPELTCRLPGLARRSPVRIVVDSRLRLPPTGRLVRTAEATPTWVVTVAGADAEKRRRLEALGVRVIEVEATAEGRVDLAGAAKALAGLGLTRVLAEGGGSLAAGLLRAGLADRLAWFQAPRLIGADGIAAAEALGVASLAEAPSFVRACVRIAGADLLETLVRKT